MTCRAASTPSPSVRPTANDGDVRPIPLDQMHHILRPAAIAYDLPALIGDGFRQCGT